VRKIYREKEAAGTLTFELGDDMQINEAPMTCELQRRLLKDENDACAAHAALPANTPPSERQRLWNFCADARTAVRLHLSSCPVCKRETGQPIF
jgi:hypothetical protein